MSETKNRAGLRKTTAYAAICFGDDGVSKPAVVCDVSAQGLHLRPSGDWGSAVGVGSRLRVVFVAGEGRYETKVNVCGTVRWTTVGQPQQEGGRPSGALGIELDEEDAALLLAAASTKVSSMKRRRITDISSLRKRLANKPKSKE